MRHVGSQDLTFIIYVINGASINALQWFTIQISLHTCTQFPALQFCSMQFAVAYGLSLDELDIVITLSDKF